MSDDSKRIIPINKPRTSDETAPTPADASDDAVQAKGAPDGATPSADSDAGEEAFDAVAAAAELEASLAAADDSDDAEVGEGNTDSYIAMLESEIEAANTAVEEAQKAQRAAEVRAVEAQAEVSRASERLEREAGKQLERRSRALLLAFVEVLDDLERAIDAAQESAGDDRSLLDGVELVERRFRTTLADRGVKPIDAKGKPFDANLHDALSMVPVTDDADDGAVINVIRRGYTIGDAVLRPAQVVVGKKA